MKNSDRLYNYIQDDRKNNKVTKSLRLSHESFAELRDEENIQNLLAMKKMEIILWGLS